ncbi:MAG: hypothetical protein HYV09_35080 [Deltaproteobacteria bacterium]|nr:hypothetical protein [Deltaproteobacteria bacterium]
MKRALGAVALVGLSVAVVAPPFAGCGPACPPSERVIVEGKRVTTGAARFYETSGPEGPFLPFEGATLLRIRHGLGAAPQKVVVMLAFTEHPQSPGGGGYSFAAGNQAIVLRQDADEVAIKNDSCAKYWVRVTVEALVPDDAGADAPADTAVEDASVDAVDAD